MPKRRAARGRRGGGNVGKKATRVETEESDAPQIKTDTDSNVETAVGFDESEVADESVNEDTGTEDTVDEVLSLNEDVTDSVLQGKMVEENKDQAGEINSERGSEEALDVDEATETELSNSNNDEDNKSENTALDDIKDSGIECILVSDTKNNKAEERENGGASNVEVPDESEEITDETQLETEKKVDQPGKEREQEELEEDTVKNSVEEDIPSSKHQNNVPCITFGDKEVADTEVCFADTEIEEDQKEMEEQQGEGLCLPFDDNEVVDTDVCFADKEVEGDQKEIEEVQYIDEEASEDQQSMDVLEIISSKVIVTPARSELQKIIELGKSSENPIELDENDDVPTGLMESDLQKDEEIDNSKFEEISEGSIDQDQEELIAEPISDVEITGESFEPKKAAKTSSVKEESKKPRYKEAESLEEVFFATENDFLKITAEDKDNDEVSDTSLSNHADANLSLEEISDDDLEPSKKRKKSGVTPVKTGSAEEMTTPDVDPKTAEKSEVKPNQKSASSQKRPANDDDDESPEGTANKRLKAMNEAKDGEETHSRTENEVPDDARKDVKKPQAKESDIFHGRNIAHNRNLSQSSKNGQQESRDRAVSSRDSIEHKKRYELVSTMCQTEPRQLKGKIVQCNINPVRSVPEPMERFSVKKVVESRLLAKFKKQLPSSIPEKIFLAVTSLQPPQLDNAYSFSMGPVTLSDMDCPKFRFTMTGMEEFSLVFDKHTQGIQKATLASHDRMTSLIGHLKKLELGNRYMVMSVVYRCGFGRTVSVWKATLLFMYEQDIQLESSTLVTDGKIRAKLCLRGVPKDVSKDFIHLLFPETINVCTVQGPLGERSVILGFSHEKIVEEIISCYDLLIICGSQITISRVDGQETQQCLLPDGSEESKAIPVEDNQNGKGKVLEICANESFVEEIQQKDLQLQAGKIVVQDSDKIEDSKQEQILQKDHEAATLSEGSVMSQEQGKNDSSTKESQSADSIDTFAGDILTASEVILTEITADSTAASDKLLGENVEDTSGKIQSDEVTVVLGLEQGLEEAVRACSAENSTCLDEGSVYLRSEGSLGGIALLEAASDEASKQNTTEPAVLEVADNLGEMAVGNPSVGAEQLGKTADDGSSKQESDRQDGEGPEEEAPSDTIADVTLTDAAADGGERKIDEETTDDNKSRNVNAEEEGANKEKLDKTFEDISDDETGNQSKNDDFDDVVILKQESPEWEVTEIDLTVEESDASGKVTENVIPPTQEKVVQSSSKTEELHDSIVKKGSDGAEVKNVDPKLVMTDGDLEISMEVIDVNEGEQQTEKVIYARTYRQSPDRSRERRSWDARNYKTTSYTPQPWKENQWSDASRTGAYYSSHEPYKPYYPPKESSYKMHYYPVPAPDEVSYYRAPVRESTSYRRDPYYYKQKSHRNSSPSPRREMNLHRHSGSRDHRPSDHWDSRRYDSWHPSSYEDSKKQESYPRPPAEYSSRQAYWQAHSTTHHSPPPTLEASHSSARPRDHYTRGGSRGPYESDRKRKSRKSRSRSLSDMSMSSAELPSPVRKPSYRRESPKRPAAHTSRSPISVSSRSRSLSPVSKSPSLEYAQPGTGKDKLVKTVKHFLELAKGIKQAHRRQSNRSPSPKSPPLRRSKSPQHSRHRSPSVSSSTLRRALHSPRHTESRRLRSKSPHQLYARKSRSPVYSKSHKRRYDRSSSGSSHGDDYKRRYKERYSDKRTGSYHRQSPDRRHESRKAQKTEISHTASDQSGKAKSGQWSDSKYKSSNAQSWQQPYGSYPVAPSSGPVATSAVYNPTYPPPGCPPQPPTNVYSSSSVPVYPYTSPSQFYSNIPPPYLHVPPPAPVAQTYQAPGYTVYQPGQPYAPLQAGSSSSMNLNASNASSKTKSWSMGNSAMVFQRVLGTDKKGGKANKSGVISKIEDRKRLERPKVTKTERVLTTVQMEKK